MLDREYHKSMIITGVYGYNDRIFIFELWEDLKNVAMLINDQAWTVFCDFNIVRFA